MNYVNGGQPKKSLNASQSTHKVKSGVPTTGGKKKDGQQLTVSILEEDESSMIMKKKVISLKDQVVSCLILIMTSHDLTLIKDSL